MSENEMHTAEASAEAPATDSMHAEMAATFDRVQESELAKVPAEAELTKYSDHSVSEEPTETESTETTEAQPNDGIEAPDSWNAKAKAQWTALPKEIQEYVSQREFQAQQKMSEQGRQLSEFQRGAQSPMPHMEHVQRIAQEHGLTPDDTIQRFVAADHFLKTNPEAAIQYLAQAHGVDLGKFAGDPQQQQMRQMQAQQMEQMRSEYLQWHQQREQQEQHLTAAIDRFTHGKPYWAQLEPLILQQITAMKAVDPGRVQADPMGALKEAQDLALKISGVDATLPERQAQARKRADEAKRLASLNVRSTTSSPNVQYTSMEEEMRATYERLNGRH